MLGIPRFKVHLRFVINSQALLLRMTSLAKKRCDAELSQVKENFKFIKSKGLFLAGPQKTFKYPRNKNAGELGYKETAVLFLVGSEPETQGLQVLLTKRSTTVGTFKGQACLPGGSRESQDATLIHTALREAQEETGVDLEAVDVVGHLPPSFIFHRGLRTVTPVVALLKCPIHSIQLVPNPAEVDTTYWVPLDLFLDNIQIKQDNVMWPHLLLEYQEPDSMVKHQIWGFTARVCVLLSSIALNRRPRLPKYQPSLVTGLVRNGEEVSIQVCRVATTREELLNSKL